MNLRTHEGRKGTGSEGQLGEAGPSASNWATSVMLLERLRKIKPVLYHANCLHSPARVQNLNGSIVPVPVKGRELVEDRGLDQLSPSEPVAYSLPVPQLPHAVAEVIIGETYLQIISCADQVSARSYSKW